MIKESTENYSFSSLIPDPSSLYVEVALPLPLRRTFTYRLPVGWRDNIKTYWNFLRKQLSNKSDVYITKRRKISNVNKNFLTAFLIAILLVAGGILLIWKFQPSTQEQQEQMLSGAFRAGSPEFDAITKKIIAENDEDKTWFSPVGTGGIVMNIAGKLRNISDKTLTGLEINVAVLDLNNKVVKEKTMIVVPTQQKKLEPKGEMNVVVVIEGFKPDDDRARIRWKVTAIKTE